MRIGLDLSQSEPRGSRKFVGPVEHQQALLALLNKLRSLEPLKELFWSRLNYERVNQPLFRRAWGQTAANALADDIIGQSLYGVDVMDWAVHVAELRLWLALIIDAEFSREELHVRNEPLLPRFTFRLRCGESLVQEVVGINLGR